MPEVSIALFQEEDGTVPVVEWIRGLNLKAQVKCIARIKRLKERGYQLPRSELRSLPFQVSSQGDGDLYLQITTDDITPASRVILH